MIKHAYLAGGCFWGLEELIRTQPGVINVDAGYTGGTNENPDYNNHPGHAESLDIQYDDTQTSFWKLLDFFFQIHNPTTLNQQGNDIGTSYRSAIFYQNDSEKQQAADFITIVNDSKRWPGPVVTTLEPFTKFWKAEEYHQDYLQKNPNGYTCHAIWFGSYLSEK
jgi:peptide-methionine (S)-S-oxide reductase